MRLVFLINAFIWTFLAAVAQHTSQLLAVDLSNNLLPLEKLQQFIDTNSHRRHYRKQIYTKDNIKNRVSIPQYDLDRKDYEGSPYLHPYFDEFEELSLPYITEAAATDDQETLVYLADLYMFGQSDIKPNYTRALEYYKRAVALAPHGHAYFMLGFIYSTGLFGEVPKDKAKSNLYYHFASKNGNLNATLVLANKHYHGIDRPPNCDLAKFYYSRAARAVKQHQHEHGYSPDTGNPLHNIRLSDFNGGLYGSKVSDPRSSFLSLEDSDDATKNYLDEMDYNHDPELRDFYYDAIAAYTGTRFQPMNHSLAFSLLSKCNAHAKAKFSNTPRSYVSNKDRNFWSRCTSLQGNMYLDGRYVERDIPKAWELFTRAVEIFDSGYTRSQLGKFHTLDPMTHGQLSDNCTKHFQAAAGVDNLVSKYYLVSWRSTPDPNSPFVIENTEKTFQLWRELSNRKFYNAHFYYADAMESGDGAPPLDVFFCSNIVDTYKQFVELSEPVLFPHLKYAFTEFSYGYYKNALLGYLIAAEQGLQFSQVSAAYLLYQADPIFTLQRKTFDKDRLQSAMTYLELASLQGDVDSTMLLGDIFYDGIKSANISRDYGKSFDYYNRAVSEASAHGCFKLGHMYEYGLGSANATVDYHMAKRYYDLSLDYVLESMYFKDSKLNTYPMSLALLRLRIKLLFSRDKKEVDKAGWFSTFKQLGRSQDSADDNESDDNRAVQKSTAQFEGGDYEGEDEYEIFDYVVLFLTIVFFVFVFILNMRGQIRRAANGPNEQNPGRNAFEQNAFGFRRGNFEFHFLAL